MSSLWHFRAFYRNSGAAYGSVERVYRSLGKDMGSMWLSRAVYRKSMAVYGCEGESICSLPKRTVLFGSPGQCTDSLWQCR